MERLCEETIQEERTSAGERNGREKAHARKKRRGLIEKRRRDRINGCLQELRHLVPKAFEKQGSSKLEKAEILSLTVEHLRYLRRHQYESKAARVCNTNYRDKGFRECLSEVKRCIATEDGTQSSEDFRNRLVEHLTIFNAAKNAYNDRSSERLQSLQMPAKSTHCSSTPNDLAMKLEPRPDKSLTNHSNNRHLVYTTGAMFPPNLDLRVGQYMHIISRASVDAEASFYKGPVALLSGQY